MKKGIALLLALMMIGMVGLALAESETIHHDDGSTENIRYNDDGSKAWSERIYPDGSSEYLDYYNGKVSWSRKSTSDGSYESFSYDENGKVVWSSKGTVERDENGRILSSVGYEYDENGKLSYIEVEDSNGYVSFDADGTLINGWMNDGTVEYDAETGKWFEVLGWDDEYYHPIYGDEVSAPDLSAYLRKAGFNVKPDVTWYTHNTVGVIGVSLRDEYPTLTKKWYNVLPVDLSKDGSQTFQLVASNMYYVGTVTVTVSGDSVTTTYNYPTKSWYEFYPEEECIRWFAGVDQIDSVFLENPTSDMKFGEAISKSKDLNGQDIGLLFVCNRLTYRVPYDDSGAAPIRFWRNHYKMAGYFADAKALFDKLNETRSK